MLRLIDMFQDRLYIVDPGICRGARQARRPGGRRDRTRNRLIRKAEPSDLLCL